MDTTNADDLDWTEVEEGDARFQRKQLGEAADGEAIGCSLYRLPPGGKSWPYHYHTGNEEALFVLSGSGSLRIDDRSRPLEEGDYVAFPAGEGSAHRVTNDSGEPLTYLMVSTMDDPDVIVYPDSEKVGVFAGSAPGDRDGRSVHGYYRRSDDVDYWEGERDDE